MTTPATDSAVPTHELRAGDYRARISDVGGAVTALRYGERELLLAVEGEPPMPLYRGVILAPWPNRIADGRYDFRGRTHRLPVNEVDRGCALHGLLVWTTWRVLDAREDEITLTDIVWPRPGYPFTVEVRVRYQLGPDGLTTRVTARNLGDEAAPFGTAAHPYLRAGEPGTRSIEACTFRLDADSVLDVDRERLLPRGVRSVEGSDFDFRGGERIGSTELDHAFTDVDFSPTTTALAPRHGDTPRHTLPAGRGMTASATLTGADGTGTRISWDEKCRWVQVHTTDLPGHPLHRAGLAVEPMTCPPDAFNSGTALIVLEPGAEYSVAWRIDAVT